MNRCGDGDWGPVIMITQLYWRAAERRVQSPRIHRRVESCAHLYASQPTSAPLRPGTCSECCAKMKGLLCIVLLLISSSNAQLEDYELPEEWKDYDTFYDYGMIKEEADKLFPGSEELDKKVLEDIKKYTDKEESYNDFDDSYQIEDNRSNDEQIIDENKDKSNSDEVKEKSTENPAGVDNNDKSTENRDGADVMVPEGTTKKGLESIIDEVIDKDPKAGADNDYHLLWGDDDLAPLPVPEEEERDKSDNDESIPAVFNNEIEEKMLKETLELLKEDEKDGNDFDLPLPIPKDDDINQDLLEETKTILQDVDSIKAVPEDVKQNIEDIVDETKKLLEEGDSSNEQSIPVQKEEDLEYEISKLADEIDKAEDKLEDDGDDTVGGAMENLNNDLDKLFDTLDKLREGFEEVGDKTEKKIEDVFGSDQDDLYDEIVEDSDDDYEDIKDSNLSEIFAEINTPAIDEDDKDNDDKVTTENLNDVIKDILAEEEKVNSAIEKENSEENEDVISKEENNIESMQDDAKEKPIMYQNDALLDGESKEDESLVEEFDADKLKDNQEGDKKSDENKENVKENNEMKPSTKMVDDLTSEELDALMEQFKLVHGDDFEAKSDVAPIHVKLSVDEPVIITSPNYPNPYPTNNIIDWMFEGDGMGIELIIEDFAVNGALGDYLLVKPGGVDASGQEGLVFSYRLNSERRYRFMDVNKMFVRFEARLGMMFMRGFKFSVRMISPSSAFDDIHLPEPEELITREEENLTLNLAISIIDFHYVKDDFTRLLADMAERYIIEQDIDPGLNTTAEVTKILQTAVCNYHWPNYERCVEMTFAVPLTYENETAEIRLSEEDLRAMWRDLRDQEPFAHQLANLGISEYSMPDDRSVVTAWGVIAFGVLVSVAMLAFALWRYSCFEDYTRMRAFGDTDSLKNEKRTLDLYPTPHQTLPPLYAENEYKWHDDKYDGSTRVNMGGYANKSYVRDELYGFDSDEDVIPARERYTTDV